MNLASTLGKNNTHRSDCAKSEYAQTTDSSHNHSEPVVIAHLEHVNDDNPKPQNIIKLFMREEKVMRSYILRLVGNQAHADDIFQETYLRVLEKSRTVTIHEPLAYIYRTARNLASDIHKSAKRTSGDLNDELLCEKPTPEENTDAQKRLQIFMLTLKKMPRLRREVFLRRRLHGQSYQQISEELGLSMPAVEKHISRALAFLNDHYAANV